MVPAADALIVDSTGLDLDEVVDRIEREVRLASTRPSPDTSSLPTVPPPFPTATPDGRGSTEDPAPMPDPSAIAPSPPGPHRPRPRSRPAGPSGLPTAPPGRSSGTGSSRRSSARSSRPGSGFGRRAAAHPACGTAPAGLEPPQPPRRPGPGDPARPAAQLHGPVYPLLLPAGPLHPIRGRLPDQPRGDGGRGVQGDPEEAQGRGDRGLVPRGDPDPRWRPRPS